MKRRLLLLLLPIGFLGLALFFTKAYPWILPSGIQR